MMFNIRPALRVLALLAALLGVVPAHAAVEIGFYSREFGSRFPHAFITLRGTPDRGGDMIDANYGFSATTLSPAILMGRVKGKVFSESDSYVRGSADHFTMTLSDAEYDSVMGVVERWNAFKQPSYDLGKQNCVFFVADVAARLGMTTDTSRFMKKPNSFLRTLVENNRAWLAARQARFGKSESGDEAKRTSPGA